MGRQDYGLCAVACQARGARLEGRSRQCALPPCEHQLLYLVVYNDLTLSLPLLQLHFVLDDLPTSTKAPELDDRHTQAILDAAKEGASQQVIMGVDERLVGLYFSWLVSVGFLQPPTRAAGGQENAVLLLPQLDAAAGTKALGRGSAN